MTAPPASSLEGATEPAAPLPPGITRADFFTGPYRISAEAHTGDRRLVDALRDPSRQYLDVRRVRVTALDGLQPPAEYSEGLLSKAEIEWVAIRAEPARMEARLYGFVKKVPLRVAVVLQTCRIEGTVHVDSMTTDPVLFFLRGIEKATERFVAVTDATVTRSSVSAEGSLRLAIVNRAAVRLFSAVR